MSTVGVLITMGKYRDACGGYHRHSGDAQYREGHHENDGEYHDAGKNVGDISRPVYRIPCVQ